VARRVQVSHFSISIKVKVLNVNHTKALHVFSEYKTMSSLINSINVVLPYDNTDALYDKVDAHWQTQIEREGLFALALQLNQRVPNLLSAL
jgi:hypothetical protein